MPPVAGAAHHGRAARRSSRNPGTSLTHLQLIAQNGRMCARHDHAHHEPDPSPPSGRIARGPGASAAASSPLWAHQPVPAADRHRSTRSTAHPALPHRADPSGASAARYSCNSAPAWHAQDGTRTLPRQPFTLILDRVKLSLFAVQRFSRLPIRLYGMYRQGQPSVSNDFDFYDRSAHPISSLPQPLTNYDQALDVVLLLARTDTTVHNPHSQWCHGGVESGQLGQEFPIFPDHRDRPRAPLSARTGFPNAAASCTSSLPPLAWQVHMDGTQSRGPPGWWKRGRRPGVGRTPACRSAWHWVP